MTNRKPPLAIIGSGGAAVHAIKSIRGHGYEGEVHLMTDSVQPPYNPMLLTYYIGGKIPLEQCYISGSGFDFYKNYDVVLHQGMSITELNVQEKTLINSGGVSLQFDSCLIACGASPVIPPVSGAKSQRVFTIRTIEDAIRLRELYLTGPKRVVLVGASMVGIKLVEIFHDIGSQVYLVDLASHLFPQAAHPACADLMEAELRNRGIELVFNSKVDHIEETHEHLKVQLSNTNTELDADLLVFCIGVKPNIGFINPESMQIDRGVIVNSRMQACDGIYAAGDIAQALNMLSGQKEVIALWANACQQGQIAGANMAGFSVNYPGSIPQNITHFFDIYFAGIGNVQHADQIEQTQTSTTTEILFWKNNQIIGANIVSIREDDIINQVGSIRYQILKTIHQRQLNHLPQNSLIQKLLSSNKQYA